MAKITVIGSASGMPVATRSHAAILLELEQRSYLLDVGEGCASSLLRHEVDHGRIQAAFVSHMHPDHSIGLPMLLQMMHLAGRERPLSLYLPAEAVAPTSRYLDTLYVFQEKLPFEFEIEPIRPNPIYRDDELTISAYQNRHLEGYKELVARRGLDNQLQSYSFVILAENKKLIYSGDMGGTEDLREILSGPDLLITECMHMDPEELMVLLAEKQVPRIVLTHLPTELEGKEPVLLQLAQKHGVQDVLVAHDGLSLHL